MHCGSHYVCRDAVQDGPTPEKTDTSFPITYIRRLDIAEDMNRID